MKTSSAVLSATLRALRGAADPHIVAPALGDRRFARILALAPGVHPIVGALGALAGKVPDLLIPGAIESPALHAAIAALIGTDAGDRVLEAWAWVAPAGWGAPHDAALINAVHNNRCAPWVAAALIGPCDASAALLSRTWDIARAVQRWGRTTPDHPTAWMEGLSSTERKRLVNMLAPNGASVPSAAAICLPWLPRHCVAEIAEHIAGMPLLSALDAYACASPIARARHIDILSALIERGDPDAFAALTCLAVVPGMGEVWNAVARLLRASPHDAVSVVATVEWNDVCADIRETILSAVDSDSSGICAALAFACGERSDPPAMTPETARAFFAAVTPAVWTALPAETQHAWRAKIVSSDIAVLAVRSLGPDPAFLAHADLNNRLITTVRRHRQNDDAVRRTLLPVAVHALPPDAIPVVVAALPASPDPIAFVQIAGGAQDMLPALRDWIATRPVLQAWSAVTLLLLSRALMSSLPITLADRCMALAAAFAETSIDQANALLVALPNDMRQSLRLDRNTLANALAHSNHTSAIVVHQVLDSLAALPPAASAPAFHALDALTQATKPFSQRQAGACLARALRNHGDCFLAIMDTLADAPRREILPLPRSASRAAAMRALAAADPLTAHRLAHALQSRSPTAVLDTMTDAPYDALTRIWHLLPDALRQSVPGDRYALASAAAAPGGADALMQTLRAWEEDNNPLPLLALRMLIDDNPDRRAQGVAVLARRPRQAVALLPLFQDDLQTALTSDPVIAFASADMPPLHPSAPAQRRRRSQRGRAFDDERRCMARADSVTMKAMEPGQEGLP